VWIFVAVLIVGSLFLGACQGAATPAPAPEEEKPAVEQPTEEAQPAATEAPEEEAATEEPQEEVAATEEPQAGLTIAYIKPGTAEYYEYGLDGAKMAAEQLGVNLIVFESEGNLEKEIANVEDAIQQGVDGIILFSVGKSSKEAAMELIDEAGIPLGIIYGYDPALADKAKIFVEADAAYSGQVIGEWVAANVDEGKVAIIQGKLGRGDAETYTEAFKTAMAANPNLEVVAEPEGGWDRSMAVAAMEDILTRFPDLKAAFIQNEDMSLGAIEVIKDQEADVVIVTQNGTPAGLDAIAAGSIAATVGWSPSEEATMVLSRLYNYVMNGVEPDPVHCNTPMVVITADNVDEAHPWVPTEQSTANALVSKCGNE